jgi:hypothetical protein
MPRRHAPGTGSIAGHRWFSMSIDLWRLTSTIFRTLAPASALLVRNPLRSECLANSVGSRPARLA